VREWGISRLIGKFYDVVTMLKMRESERNDRKREEMRGNERKDSESGFGFKFSV
jgi:hypothetical protein